jgi:hypothetical protein
MKRSSTLKALGLVAVLANACPACESSCVSAVTVPTIAAEPSMAALFARSDGVAPTAAMTKEWVSLRARYQEALRTSGASPLLTEARLAGSLSLLTGSDEGRADMRSAIRRVSDLASTGACPSLRDMHALHACISGASQGERALRGAGQLATPGLRSERAYLPGELVDDALVRVFADLMRERAGRDPAETPAIAARLDQRLASIHPYIDGNGRIARLMADWVLALDGYPPILPSRSAALYWTHSAHQNVEAAAHLERVTAGMRASVELLTLTT